MPVKFSRAILLFAAVLCARVSGGALLAQQQTGGASQNTQNPAAQQQEPSANRPQTGAPTAQNPQQAATPPAQPTETLTTVVIDPGHGGADTGARGPSGVEEKNIVMDFARDIGDALRAEGFTVVMTRIADVDPSLDERDAIANAQKDAIFISLHVGSTGPAGTVRSYTYMFPSAAPQPGDFSTSAIGSANSNSQPVAPPGFLLWSEAQKPFLVQSGKLGDLIQVELAPKFKGSPEISESAPVGVLRSAAVPAVAVEISNIGEDEQSLQSISGDLAAGIARAVAAYKTIYPAGGKS